MANCICSGVRHRSRSRSGLQIRTANARALEIATLRRCREGPGLGQEKALIGLDDRVFAAQVLQRGDLGALRMEALRDLRERVGIAQKDDGLRGSAHGDDVGQGHLPRLVEEEDVEAVFHSPCGRRATE